MADKQIHDLTLVNRSELNAGTSYLLAKDTTRADNDEDVRVPLDDFVAGAGALNPVEAEMLMRRNTAAAAAATATGEASGGATVDLDAFLAPDWVLQSRVDATAVSEIGTLISQSKQNLLVFDIKVNSAGSGLYIETHSGGVKTSTNHYVQYGGTSTTLNVQNNAGYTTLQDCHVAGSRARGFILLTNGAQKIGSITAFCSPGTVTYWWGGMLNAGISGHTYDEIVIRMAGGSITGRVDHYAA